MKRLQRDSSCAFAQQDKLLKEIRSRLDAVDKCILASSSLLVKTVKKARQTWFLQLGQELKTLLFKTLAMNLVIYTSVKRVQSSILDLRQALPTPNSLVTPLTHERIFYLRDAIGRESSITLNFITSYDALTAVLQVRFHGMPGLKKIIKNEFAIENRATGKDMDRNMPWECFFRPGLWFDMDMIFQTVLDEGSESPIEDTCPSCNAKSNQSQGLRIKWYVLPIKRDLFMTLQCDYTKVANFAFVVFLRYTSDILTSMFAWTNIDAAQCANKNTDTIEPASLPQKI
jgi:hypothetical protein